MKKIVLLKLGGSLITDKTKPFTLFAKNIKLVATEIKQALKKDESLSLIIGAGTGSFGHYPVQKYGLEKGIRTKSHKYGFCSVHESVSKLNAIVVEELLQAGIHAFSLHPSSMLTAKNGNITQFFYLPIIHMIQIGMIPVIHGDMLFDEDNGSLICSVEMIFNQLVLVLHGLKSYAPSVIYAGLTDGVLDSKNNTIPLITRKNFDSINTLLTGAKGYDVTGGMKTKVVSCLENSEYGVTSLIINGSEKGNIKQALLGKEIKGTIIR